MHQPRYRYAAHTIILPVPSPPPPAACEIKRNRVATKTPERWEIWARGLGSPLARDIYNVLNVLPPSLHPTS